MIKYLLSLLLIILLFSCSADKEFPGSRPDIAISQKDKALQDSIINEHLKRGAWTKGLYSREWQEEIDKGLAKDSTIAYLWQQKAMPLFKQGKYELGIKYIDKAVKYNRQEWQEYRAFMKCIFAKRYQEAIDDFEDCIAHRGNSYVMDHSYYFFIGLSHIQLNNFAQAEVILKEDLARQSEAHGADWVHYLDHFYLGIALYEQAKYQEAITALDKALKIYPQFSEALFYKGHSIGRLGDKEAGNALTSKAREYGEQGYSVNEDNSIYERYPYQIRWELYD